MTPETQTIDSIRAELAQAQGRIAELEGVVRTWPHPRIEKCCECNVYVADWVEASHRNGRICRPCETVIALRAQNLALATDNEKLRETLRAIEDGSQGKGTGRHIAAFILYP